MLLLSENSCFFSFDPFICINLFLSIVLLMSISCTAVDQYNTIQSNIVVSTSFDGEMIMLIYIYKNLSYNDLIGDSTCIHIYDCNFLSISFLFGKLVKYKSNALKEIFLKLFTRLPVFII